MENLGYCPLCSSHYLSSYGHACSTVKPDPAPYLSKRRFLSERDRVSRMTLAVIVNALRLSMREDGSVDAKKLIDEIMGLCDKL